MPEDKLFDVPAVAEDFAFDARVAAVFDDMITRSVPHYALVVEAIVDLAARLTRPGDQVLDVGCSTGTTLLALAADARCSGLHLTGVDLAQPMIDRAQEKARAAGLADRVTFLCRDARDVADPGLGMVLMNYTLQFLRPIQRLDLLQRLRACLRPGGVLVVSEKVVLADGALNRAWIDVYHQHKRRQGYSDVEIARKREALENVLVPYTLEENVQLLKDAGFATVEVFFRWFNFVSLVARSGLQPQP